MPTAKKGTKTSGKSSAGNRAAGGMKAKGGKPAGPKKRAGAEKRKPAGRRELINTGTDKRFVRRDGQGQFKESDDVGRSLSADRRRRAKTRSKSGQGDRGDR